MEWNDVFWDQQGHSEPKERQKKTGQEKKHPTKLVKAATCCLLSPLTTTMGWKLRGMIYVGNKEMNEKHLEYVMKNSNAIYLVL